MEEILLLKKYYLPFNTNNVVMASFDIKSLFTNIPLDETIDIIANIKCFYNTSRFHGFTVQQFTNLLTMSKTATFFSTVSFIIKRMVLLWDLLLDLYSPTYSCHFMNVLG